MREHVMSLLSILVWAAVIVLAVFLFGSLEHERRHVDAMQKDMP